MPGDGSRRGGERAADGGGSGPGSEAERFEPELHGPLIAYEHVHRYVLAAELFAGARVLDLASGSGHGSRLLRSAGVDVIALDVDADCARRAAPGVCASGSRLPFADESFDGVVCFETIEHLDEPAALVAEMRRVLKRGGVTLLSTPDRTLYTDRVGNRNPYHVSELSRDELEALLSERFGHVALFGQSVWAGSWISRLGGEDTAVERSVFVQRAEVQAELQREPTGGADERVTAPWVAPDSNAPHNNAPHTEAQEDSLPTPLYLVALCARQKAAFARAARRIGSDRLLDDRAQWLIGAYLAALEALLVRDRDVEGHQLNARNLEERVIERNAHVAALTSQLEEREGRVRQLEGHVANLEPDLEERAARVKTLEDHVKGLEREAETARERSRELERHTADLEGLADASQAHAENLDRELSEARTHVRNLESSVGEAEAHARNLEQAVREAEARLEDARSADEAARTHLEARLDGAEQHGRNLEEALGSVELHGRNLEAALGEAEQHGRNLEELLAAERGAAEAATAALQLRGSELEDELARVSQALESVRRRADESAEALARIRATRAYRALQALALLEPREEH